MASIPDIDAIRVKAEATRVPISAVMARAGVATSTWYRWIHAKTDPRVSVLRRVAAALDQEIIERATSGRRIKPATDSRAQTHSPKRRADARQGVE